MNRADSGGFTLIELLVVLALVMVMYVMAYGPASKSYQTKQLIACQRNLQMIQIALKIYAADYHDSYPVVPGAPTAEIPLSLLVPRCTAETSIFLCPGSAARRLPEARPFADRKISYAYYMGHTLRDGADDMLLSDHQLNTQPRHTGEPMFSVNGKRPADNHRQFGGNLLFCDGHAEQLPPAAPRDLLFTNPIVLLNPKL
ncbi:MAG TPA: prepilin-type N-terminal cleavage/methylation domain-containing protein [Verrucomicrobiae bacterium]|nr:prepilin-type N-terminal cleavage/methylation domain-containing protein [Verrucomicrobiae bacterium]